MRALVREIQVLNEEVQKENLYLTQILKNLLSKPQKVRARHRQMSKFEETKQYTAAKKLETKPSKDTSFSVQRSQSTKTVRKCDSCKSLKKSRDSDKSLTVKHDRIMKSKHQNNMMKLEKLSQKIVPKVSKQWLFKKKAKIFHFS